jgi:transcriptional regulator with XRE-family HTH domain
MSPPSTHRPPTPVASSLAHGLATTIGTVLLNERRRRRWTARDLAARARVSRATVTNVEAGRRASLDVYARLAEALRLPLEIRVDDQRHRRLPSGTDLVHAAMGEIEARWLHELGYEVAIDHPYQHYQFAGRADVLAWTLEPHALLHIENRTRFPDLQEAAGSYNAKRQYLAKVVAGQLGIAHFASETHVLVGLWSAEVIHSIRLRSATFHALGPDSRERLDAWLRGDPPAAGTSSSVVLLDPFASGRQAPMVGLEDVLAGARPRVRGYPEAAERLRTDGRA